MLHQFRMLEDIGNAIEESLRVHKNLEALPPYLLSFGSALTNPQRKARTFNLSGIFPEDEKFPDYFDDNSLLNKAQVLKCILSDRNRLQNFSNFYCSQKTSFLVTLSAFVNNAGYFYATDDRCTQLLSSFAEAYISSDSGKIVDSLESVPVVANLALSVIMLNVSVKSGQYDKNALLQDFCDRIRLLQTKQTSHFHIFSSQFIGAIFEELFKDNAALFPQIGTKNAKSFLFTNIDRKDVISWSRNSSQYKNEGKVCILSCNAVYIFENETTNPSLCVPLSYVRVQVSDCRANVLQLFPKSFHFPIIIFVGEERSTVEYEESFQIEFINIECCNIWFQFIEQRLWEIAESACSESK